MRRILFFLSALLSLQIASAQTLRVTGVVTSADDGLPLPGVSVIVKDSSTGTSTDLDGRYSIDVGKGQTLLFTSIGFADHEENIIRGGI